MDTELATITTKNGETAKPPDQGWLPGRFALIGSLLFVALVFTTVTVWVTESWPLQIFQIGIFSLIIIYILCSFSDDRPRVGNKLSSWLVYLIPAWGVLQLVAHTSSATFETRGEVLRWGSLAGVFYLSQRALRTDSHRQRFLSALLGFATGMAVLCLMQLDTSQGRILWFIDTHFTDIFATFQNKNNYVQFVELALPIALWGAVREGWRSWWYALSGSLLYASAIAVASRAGFILCSLELVAVLIIGLVEVPRKRGRESALRSAAALFLVVPAVAGAFTFAVGWRDIQERFQEKDPYAIRREFLIAAVEMVKNRPIMGHGLGTFEQVYQAYAVKDFPFYANHAHNDWAEFAADGGIPFLLLVLIPFLTGASKVIRYPWALGLVAVMLNAVVDFPFPRPAVSGWMFAILALVYASGQSQGRDPAPSWRDSDKDGSGSGGNDRAMTGEKGWRRAGGH